MKIKTEYYDQVGAKKEKVEVYGSHRLCRHIEEDHTVKEIANFVAIDVDPDIKERKLGSLSEEEMVKYLSNWTVYSCTFCGEKDWTTQNHLAGQGFKHSFEYNVRDGMLHAACICVK